MPPAAAAKSGVPHATDLIGQVTRVVTVISGLLVNCTLHAPITHMIALSSEPSSE